MKEEFSKRSKDFETYSPTFSFHVKLDLIDLKRNPFDLSHFEWMHIDSFEMETIELTT